MEKVSQHGTNQSRLWTDRISLASRTILSLARWLGNPALELKTSFLSDGIFFINGCQSSGFGRRHLVVVGHLNAGAILSPRSISWRSRWFGWLHKVGHPDWKAWLGFSQTCHGIEKKQEVLLWQERKQDLVLGRTTPLLSQECKIARQITSNGSFWIQGNDLCTWRCSRTCVTGREGWLWTSLPQGSTENLTVYHNLDF